MRNPPAGPGQRPGGSRRPGEGGRLALLLRLAAPAALALLIHACTTSTVTGVDVGSVVVEPATVSLAAGQEIAFRAVVRDAEGAVVSGAEVAWSSGAPTMVAVGQDGVARGLRAGTTTVSATFQGATGSASVTVLPGPEIAVSRDSVGLYADVTASPPDPVTLDVSNAGAGTLEGLSASVEYETGSGWLSPGLNATTAPAVLTLVASPAGLPVGSYRAVVVLAAPATLNSPLRIPVALSVTQGQPILALTRSDLGLDVPPGSSTAGSVSMQVTNRGAGSLVGLSVSTAHPPGAATGWLSATLAEGEEGATLDVGVDPTGLAEGRYPGEVRVTAANAVNSPLVLPVTLEVSPDAEPWVGFTVSQTEGSTRVVEGGGTDQVSVVLDAAPRTAVVLEVGTSDPAEARAHPSTLLFGADDWSVPRTVTVEAVDDDVFDGDRTTTLTVAVDDARSDDAFDAFPDQTVPVVTVDDDTPPQVAITGPSASTFVQGQPVTFSGTAQDREDGPLAGAGLVWTSSRQTPPRIGTGSSFTRSDLVVGTHAIELTATDSDGHASSDRITLTITAPPQQPPVAGFTVRCSGVECAFTDASSDPDGSVVAWSWAFGDGATSTERNPTHRYAGDGTFTVRLTVTDDDGASGSVSRSLTISGRPTADFAAACSGLTCSFTDQSFDPDGSVAAWSWDFGDGASSTQRSPTHSYATGGSYTVTLVVTDDDGRVSAPATRTVEANAPPEARFTASCSRLQCAFTESSTDPDGSVAAWSWAFGDGATSTQRNPTHAYTVGGSYTVRLTVTDDRGATGTTTRSVTVSAPPTADFTASCDGLACTFSDRSTDPGGTIVARDWTFGDGATASGAQVSHTYASGGDYTVTLTVTDDDGETDDATRVVSVNEPPVARFDVDCDDPTCDFEDESTDPDGSVVAWSWDFGGDGSSAQRNPSHTFSRGGTWEVTLTVTDDDGATDSFTRSVTVDAPPLASFTYDCDGLDCSFTDTSIDPGGFINLRVWQMGDGTVRFGQTVRYLYKAAGSYTVTLTVVDDDGDTDQASRTVTVPPPP